MNKLRSYFFIIFSICIYLGATGTVHAGATNTLIFSDNFDNLTSGSLSGQNGWTTAGATWTVTATTSGKNIVGGNAGYNLAPISQTASSSKDTRLVFDFLAPQAGQSGAQAWLRRTGTASTAAGYDLFWYLDGNLYLDYITGTTATLLTSTAVSLTRGTWYTIEFEAINDSSGRPVLKGWIYPQNTSRPASPNVTYTDTTKYLPNSGYVGIGGFTSSVTADNVYVYSGDFSVPSAPTDLGAIRSATQAVLHWNAPSNGGMAITDYIIKYRTGSDAFSTFDDGTSTATTTSVTGLLSNTAYDFEVYAVNIVGSSTAATLTATTTSSGVAITSPYKMVTASSSVATIGINRIECNETFYIPYIQTSNSLSVSALVESTSLPAGGGVKFVLTSSTSVQTVAYDLSAPFTATFNNLAKGEYTLDTYIVDSNQVVQSESTNHDTATNIAIGDVYIAIGDSVTEGYDGTAYNVSPYTDWTNVPVKSTDSRNYPQCGISNGYYQDHWQEVSHHISLNNELESYYGYPVFILNEGVAGITSAGYITRMASTTWQTRISSLQPNKWLVHLGINDGSGSAGFQSNMQTIINTIRNTYGALSKDIILAVPSANSGFLTYIKNLVSINSLTAGPDFKTYYTNHSSDILTLYSGVHPTVAGHTQMARLWGVTAISPKNISISQTGSNIVLNWDSLTPVESSIAGYKVYYGLSTTTLNSIVDAGSATTAVINSGINSGNTYYFGIQGYDNDLYSPIYTATSSFASIAYDTTAPVISSINAVTTQNNAVVTWTTNVAASSSVNYGLNTGYGSTVSSQALATSHSLTISGLSPGILYHYRVSGADSSGNITNSADQTFITQGRGSYGGRTPRNLSYKNINTTTILPSNKTNPFSRNLALRSFGEDVKSLQQILINKGFLSNSSVTGYFGLQTYQALVKYQKSVGILPASGYFGPITRQSLNTNTK